MNAGDQSTGAQGVSVVSQESVFQLWRRVFIPTFGIFLLVHLPARLAAHVSVSGSGLRDYWSHPVVGVLAANSVLLASFVIVEGALIAYVAARSRREASLEAALRQSFNRFPQLLLARLLYFVFVGCGLVLFVVPGVIVAVLFSMHGWVIIAEDRSVVSSLRRSFELVRGRVLGTIRHLLPATLASLVWLTSGFALLGLLLRAVRPFPVFKLAPFAMVIIETGIILPVLAIGLLFYRYRSDVAGAGAAHS
jgi:hypothetical protein